MTVQPLTMSYRCGVTLGTHSRCVSLGRNSTPVCCTSSFQEQGQASLCRHKRSSMHFNTSDGVGRTE